MHAKHIVAGFVTTVALVTTGLVVHAQRGQQAGGRGGQPQPPVKAHVNDVDSSYPRMPLAPGDETYAGLDGARHETVCQ